MVMIRHNGGGKRVAGKRIKVVQSVLRHILVLKSDVFFRVANCKGKSGCNGARMNKDMSKCDQAWAVIRGYKGMRGMLLHPYNLWVQKVQISDCSSSLPPLIVPIPQAAFMEEQLPIVGPHHHPKFGGKKPIATIKVTLQAIKQYK